MTDVIDEGTLRNILVEPTETDEMRWYRLQTFGKWYAVKACCRSCATSRLHAWTFQWGVAPSLQGEIKTVETPDWLIPLKENW